jgi:hypothetical protein
MLGSDWRSYTSAMKESNMNRRILAAVGVLALAPTAVFAQFGGMGGMGGGMGGMGGGGQGMGMAGMGGIGGTRAQRSVERTVEVELASGQKLTGKIQLDWVFVETEVGRYQIKPEQIKTIRLTGKAVPREGPMEEPGIEGTVTTSSGREIKGKIRNNSWLLDVEIGSLALDSSKVKSMTFAAPGGAKGVGSARGTDVRGSQLKVTTIEGQNAVGLMISGPRITRVAAAPQVTGDWVAVDLREPVEGRAVPVVGQGIVVYGLGSHIYAYSSMVNRWDVLDLPEGIKAAPIVGPGTARVEYDGHVHEFQANIGKWKHIDTKAILNEIQEKALRALGRQEKSPEKQ